MNKKVTIDFDSTLTRKDVQDYAKELIQRGVEVWVVTSRYDNLSAPMWVNRPNIDSNADLWEVLDRIGLPRWKVRFTCMSSKAEYLERTRVIWHLDDDDVELEAIVEHRINTVGIQVNSGNWKSKCEQLLND